jgi:hypothetical protein
MEGDGPGPSSDLWNDGGSNPPEMLTARTSVDENFRCREGHAGLIFGAFGLKNYPKANDLLFCRRGQVVTLRPWLNG